MTDSPPEDAWRTAHRAALDHLLRLVAESPLGEVLVLRGSMVMPAWVGDEAREPGDLDWIVPRPLMVPLDPLHPHPYMDELRTVQQWPEAADGADGYEIWKHEEFDTQGLRAVLPPEGLRWIAEPEPDTSAPYDDLLDLVHKSPVAAPGVVLDAQGARQDGTWTYSEYDTPGVRLVIPWRADGLPPGEVRVDFARDEWLPETPVWTAVPRGDGGDAAVVRTASRELSLAWKLLWLHIDCATEGRAQGKDLYDAVLLAEAEGMRLPLRLLRAVLRHEALDLLANAETPPPAVVLPESVDWAEFRAKHPQVRGTAGEWLDRLRRALPLVTGG